LLAGAAKPKRKRLQARRLRYLFERALNPP
jgi:hypothetical protein